MEKKNLGLSPAASQRAQGNEWIKWAEVEEAEKHLVASLKKNKYCDSPPPDLPLIGLALSGGGIRSATFSLGIMQTLHRLGLLKAVQYLSTVSGGGYIGSWLITAYRNGTAEKALEPESLELHHLRQYSRYLAPQSGALSADAWTIFSIWLRNTTLIQMAVILALAGLVLLPRLGTWVFDVFTSSFLDPMMGLYVSAGIAFGLIALALVPCYRELGHMGQPARSMSQDRVVLLAALPLVLSAGFAAVALWVQILNQKTVAYRFASAPSWQAALAGMTLKERVTSLFPGIAFAVMALWFGAVSVRSPNARRGQRVPWLIVTLAAVVVFVVGELGFIGLGWLGAKIDLDSRWAAGPWWSLIGPSLVLIVFCEVVVFFIGILGRAMPDEQREWWSRLGAWLFLLACAALFVGVVALPAPYWVRLLVSSSQPSPGRRVRLLASWGARARALPGRTTPSRTKFWSWAWQSALMYSSWGCWF